MDVLCVIAQSPSSCILINAIAPQRKHDGGAVVMNWRQMRRRIAFRLIAVYKLCQELRLLRRNLISNGFYTLAMMIT
jgi:hypothetical protein